MKKKTLFTFICIVLLLALLFVHVNMIKIPEVAASTDTIITTSSDDTVAKVDADYNTAWAATTGFLMGLPYDLHVGQILYSGQYQIHRSSVYFDTSVVGSREIQSASVRFRAFAGGTTNVTIWSGMPTYPHDPLQTSDYNKALYPTYCSSVIVSAAAGYFYAQLNAAGIAAITPSGYTKFLLRASGDANGNSSEQAGISLYAYETSSPSYATALIITYKSPTIGQFSAPSNVYPMKSFYLNATVNHASGTSVIKNVTLYLTGSVTLQWRNLTGGSLSYTYDDPNGYVAEFLSFSSLTTIVNSTCLKISWWLGFAWSYPEGNVYASASSIVHDVYGEYGTATQTLLFYFEDDLEFNALTVNDYHCNPSQSLTFSGYLYYQGSTTPPPDGDYQVILLLGGSQKGSTDTTLVGGAFSITTNAEATVSSYNYKCSATYTPTQGSFASVIVDKINVNIAANVTAPNSGETISSIITSTYAYSGLPSSPTINILRNSTHYATGNFTDMLAESGRYSYTTEDVTEATYGLTAFSSNTLTIIWETLVIEIDQISIPHSRVNVDSTSTSYWHCRFSNNQSSVPTGTLYVNDTNFSINSTGWAAVTFNFDSVGARILATSAVNVNGQTEYNQIVGDPTVTWDTLQIFTYEVVLSADTVSIRMVFESDGMQVSGGIISYAGYLQTTNSTGWALFNFQSVSQVAYGIEAYPVASGVVTISSQNQTIDFTKITYAPFVLRSYSAITNQTWQSGTGWLTFNASGTIIINVGTYGTPTRVTVDGENYYDWSYDSGTQRLTINNVASRVGVYWTPPEGGFPPIQPVAEGGVSTKYTVTIVVAYGASPVQGALVGIGDFSVVTDSSGIAVFQLAAGTYPITVTGILIRQYASQITVVGDATFLIDLTQPNLPPTEITTPTEPSPAPTLIDIISTNWFVVAIAIGIFAVGLIILYKKQ